MLNGLHGLPLKTYAIKILGDVLGSFLGTFCPLLWLLDLL
jgi:hypothetical protein